MINITFFTVLSVEREKGQKIRRQKMWVKALYLFISLHSGTPGPSQCSTYPCLPFPSLHPRFQPWPRQFFGTSQSLHTQFPYPSTPTFSFRTDFHLLRSHRHLLSFPPSYSSSQFSARHRPGAMVSSFVNNRLDRAKWGCETLVP